ncbi:MAG: hypothetical protein V3V00_15775 [Saprospiraceae bacterium]
MSKWNIKRIKNATIAPRVAKYAGIPANEREEKIKKSHPLLFNFNALSVGDDTGQAFIIPLDESDRELAEYILRAINAYEGE